MPAPQNVSLPPFFTMSNGFIVRVTALDPTSGAVVAGVIASNVSLSVDQSGDAPVVLTAPKTTLIAGLPA